MYRQQVTLLGLHLQMFCRTMAVNQQASVR